MVDWLSRQAEVRHFDMDLQRRPIITIMSCIAAVLHGNNVMAANAASVAMHMVRNIQNASQFSIALKFKEFAHTHFVLFFVCLIC